MYMYIAYDIQRESGIVAFYSKAFFIFKKSAAQWSIWLSHRDMQKY